MAKKFYGTFEQLIEATGQAGLTGAWHLEPNGVYMLRCDCGVNLHWASTTKTLWFDGPEGANQQVAARLRRLALPAH